jgi:hypothetical protein
MPSLSPCAATINAVTYAPLAPDLEVDVEELSLKMIYDALVAGSIGATVYDYVPPQSEGKPLLNFPYVVIGLAGSRPWDTDDLLGKDIDIYLHIWSRYKGTVEMRRIMDHIYSTLHRGNLSITGLHVVDSLLAFSQIYLDPDGVTHHGICRFKLLVQEE